MSGAERDTVGVQGPVGRLLMYECVVWGIDGCRERMGCVAGKVVDVQVVREDIGELIEVILGGKDGCVGGEAGEREGCGWCRGERRAHGRGANTTCAETVEERGTVCGGHLERRILKD